MKVIILYLKLSFIIYNSIVLANDNYHDLKNEPVGIEKLNPILNLEEVCSSYLDCYNCTVARCYWKED